MISLRGEVETMEKRIHEGGCLCGHVRYRMEGEATLAGSYCHCTMCRRATGGEYEAFVDVKKADLDWVGVAPPAVYRSSAAATRGFCGRCGSPLFFAYDAGKGISLTVGTLDDPTVFRPVRHDGVESRLPWVHCGPGLPEEET